MMHSGLPMRGRPGHELDGDAMGIARHQYDLRAAAATSIARVNLATPITFAELSKNSLDFIREWRAAERARAG